MSQIRVLITLWYDPLGLPFQRSSLPEDTGPLPQGTPVSAGVVGQGEAGQMAGTEVLMHPWKVQVVN